MALVVDASWTLGFELDAIKLECLSAGPNRLMLSFAGVFQFSPV
jgi:hypothetical protein